MIKSFGMNIFFEEDHNTTDDNSNLIRSWPSNKDQYSMHSLQYGIGCQNVMIALLQYLNF